MKNAASVEERKKFIALMQYFQKYGDKYNVDPILMAAQGYQESQLNQNAKSAVGAIGVMQVMPATGRDMKVGDITQTEANIHAGIKYMRWMIDQYYGKEPMTNLDKALFAFASYNAGAGRISSLRKEAAKRGLDPNVWFQNVEYVVAEKIGQGDGHLRQQHLQVLHRIPTRLESQAAKKEAVEKRQGRRQVTPSAVGSHPSQHKLQLRYVPTGRPHWRGIQCAQRPSMSQRAAATSREFHHVFRHHRTGTSLEPRCARQDTGPRGPQVPATATRAARETGDRRRLAGQARGRMVRHCAPPLPARAAEGWLRRRRLVWHRAASVAGPDPARAAATVARPRQRGAVVPLI